MKKLLLNVKKFLVNLFLRKAKKPTELTKEELLKEKEEQIRKRALELMEFDAIETQEKLKYHNEVLFEARQKLKDINNNSTLIFEPDEVIKHNENINKNNPILASLITEENKKSVKQLKTQAKLKNRAINVLKDFDDKKVTTSE
jgi:hypothetical protein